MIGTDRRQDFSCHAEPSQFAPDLHDALDRPRDFLCKCGDFFVRSMMQGHRSFTVDCSQKKFGKNFDPERLPANTFIAPD